MQKDWLQSFRQFQQQQALPTSTQPKSKLRILRVNQLDAQRLDYEISFGLNSYFKRIFQFFDPSLIDKFQPELNALLQFMIYRFSVYEHDASFGDRIQNLKYRDGNNTENRVTSKQKIIHALLSIGIPWIHYRLSKLSADNNWGELNEEESSDHVNWRNRVKYYTWKYLYTVEMTFKTLSLANFLVFLYDGKYRSIVDRICGMRLVYANKMMNRQVSFDYMNRELVWNGFAEMILFLIPLINIGRFKRFLVNTFRKQKGKQNHHKRPQSKVVNTSDNKYLLHNTKCPVCELDPIQVPYICNPCGHVFCYVCIQTSIAEQGEGEIICPDCSLAIRECNRAAAL